jgi:hypothetical protein
VSGFGRRIRSKYRCDVAPQAVKLARDSFYVTVGFGVIAVQKLQVQRRDLEKSIDKLLGRRPN